MANSLVVLIAVAGKNTHLEHTLKSLCECIKPQSYVGTLVIENGQKYDAETIVKKYTDALKASYLYFSQGNKSAALNYGMKVIAKDALIFFTDDDAYFDKNLLHEYEKASGDRKGGLYFGGRMQVKYEKEPSYWLKEFLPTSALDWPSDKEKVQHKFLGINWAAFAGDIKRAGGFDVRFGPGTIPRRTGQEHNMQTRLFDMGVQPVYLEKAIVWHYVPKQKSSLSFALGRQYQFGLKKGIEAKKNNISLGKLCMISLNALGKTGYWMAGAFITLSRHKAMKALSILLVLVGKIKGYSLKE